MNYHHLYKIIKNEYLNYEYILKINNIKGHHEFITSIFDDVNDYIYI